MVRRCDTASGLLVVKVREDPLGDPHAGQRLGNLARLAARELQGRTRRTKPRSSRPPLG